MASTELFNSHINMFRVVAKFDYSGVSIKQVSNKENIIIIEVLVIAVINSSQVIQYCANIE